MLPLRLLTPADAAAFRDIRLAGLAADPRAFSAALADEAGHGLDWFADRLADSTVFAADDGGRLLGVAGLAIPTAVNKRHKGLLWGVFVRPEARGQGLGARLVAAVIDAARGQVEELVLGVGTYNDAAIATYRRAGFIATGFEARALRIGDIYVDEITMTLPFGRG